MVRKIVVMLLLLAIAIAWWVWPTDPGAWRSLSTANDEELLRLTNDASRSDWERWQHYIHALDSGEPEAFQLAHRLCPLIRNANMVHPAEDLFGAIGGNLERRPKDVLELGKICAPSHPSLVCGALGDATDKKELTASYKRRRAAVAPLLDGGLSEVAAACLEELRETP